MRVKLAPNLTWPYRYEIVFLALLVGLMVSGSWEIAMGAFLLWRGGRFFKP